MSESKETETRQGEPAQPATDAATAKPPKYDWDDPKVPAGNAPPLPRWPLVASGVAFALWLGFLVVMAIVRTRTVSF